MIVIVMQIADKLQLLATKEINEVQYDLDSLSSLLLLCRLQISCN